MPQPSFTQSFDARDWAKAFVQHAKKNPDIPKDKETMTGWFANAIMRGYDEAKRSEVEKQQRRILGQHGTTSTT